MQRERVEASNARVAARRNPEKSHILTIALSFTLALSIGFAAWSYVVLEEARGETARVIKASQVFLYIR